MLSEIVGKIMISRSPIAEAFSSLMPIANLPPVYEEMYRGINQFFSLPTSVSETFLAIIAQAICTGTALFLANRAMLFLTYRKEQNDLKKIFALLTLSQIDVLMVIYKDLMEYRQKLSRYKEKFGAEQTIILPPPDSGFKFEISYVTLQTIKRISLYTSFLREDELYKQNLREVKNFNGDRLVLATRYFSRLKKSIHSLYSFTNEVLSQSQSVMDFDLHLVQVGTLITQTRVTILFGLDSKSKFEKLTESEAKLKASMQELLPGTARTLEDSSTHTEQTQLFDNLMSIKGMTTLAETSSEV